MKKWTKKIIICVVFILLMGGATGCNDEDKATSLKAWRANVAVPALTGRFAATQSVTDGLYANGFINKTTYDKITNNTKTFQDKAVASLQSESMEDIVGAVIAAKGIGVDAANSAYGSSYQIQFDDDVASAAMDGQKMYTLGELADIYEHPSNRVNAHWKGWVTEFGLIDPNSSEFESLFNENKYYWRWLNYYIPGNLVIQKSTINNDEIGSDEYFSAWHRIPEYDKIKGTDALSDIALKMVPYEDQFLSSLNEALSFTVYVLKPEQDTGLDLDHVIDAIDKVTGGQDIYSIDANEEQLISINEMLGPYFVAACSGEENSKSEAIKLIDTEKYPVFSASKWVEDSSGDEVVGHNLILSDSGVDQIEVQCYDYNPEFIDILYSIGADKGKFLLIHSEGENRAYLMEYPIYYINGFKYDVNSESRSTNLAGKDYVADLKESKLSVNILTKELVKYNVDVAGTSTLPWRSSSATEGRHMSNDIQQYLTVGGTYVDPTDNSKINTSSFIVSGIARSNLDLADTSVGGGTIRAISARVILRDYLELAFAPDCATDGENLTAFGRKMRFNFDSSNIAPSSQANPEGFIMTDEQQYTFEQTELLVGRDEQLISFVDFKGIPIKQSNASKEVKLTIKDLADVDALGKKASKNTLNVIANRNEAEGTNITTPTVLSGGDRLKVTDLEKHSIQGVRYSGSTALNDLCVIETTETFPGPLVDKADFENETIDTQLMYGMAVRSTLVDTALYSGWITSQDPQASMIAWNDFLAENALTYQVDANEVNDYLMGSYISELQEAGVIILDLNVIAKIERDMARDSTTMRNRWIQTSIYVLAWGLIIYAVLLLTAWTFDVNADFGFKLTEKLTLGNWVACADKSELPVRSSSTVQYVTLPRLLMSCFGIAALGVLLLSVSAFNLVYFLIDVFGAFAQKVETIIRGI